jgi:hypothetical protein
MPYAELVRFDFTRYRWLQVLLLLVYYNLIDTLLRMRFVQHLQAWYSSSAAISRHAEG